MGNTSNASDAAKGTLYLLSQNIVQYVAALLFFVFIARILTQAEIGEISLLIFAITLFATLTQLPVSTATTKYVSELEGSGNKAEAGAVFRTGLRLLLLISLPALMGAILISPLISDVVFETLSFLDLALLFVGVFTWDLAAFFAAALLGLRLYSRMAATNTTYFVLSRVLGVILAFLGFRVLGVVLGWLIAALISTSLGVIFLKGRFKKHTSFPMRSFLQYSLPFLVFTITVMLQNWVDVLVIYGLTVEFSTVGVYYLVVNGANVFSIIWISICTAIFPILSAEFGKNGAEGIDSSVKATNRLLNILIIPIGMVVAVVSRTALELAYGPSYVSGAIIFAVLTTTLILPANYYLMVIILQSVAKTRQLAIIGVVSIAFEGVTVFLLAGPLGVLSGAIARIVLSVSGLVLSYWALRRYIKVSLTKGLVKSIATGIFIAFPLGITDYYFTVILPQILLVRVLADGLIFFAFGLLALNILKTVEEHDLIFAREALPPFFNPLITFAEKLIIRKRKS